MRRAAWTLTGVISCLAALAPASGAQEARRPMAHSDIMAVRVVTSPAIAPDGARVVYAVREFHGETGGRMVSRDRIWMVQADAKGGMPAPVPLTAVDRDCGDPAWSPDGRFIACLGTGVAASGAAAARPQVWVMAAGGGEARAVTDAADGVSGYAWAPDSRQIAYTAREPVPAEVDARRKRGDDAAVVEEEFRLVRLWLADVAANSSRCLTCSTAMTVKGAPTWAPDSSRLAFVAAPTPMARDHRDAVYLVDVAARIEKITSAAVPHRAPSWSPDGKTIAFAFQPSSAKPLGDGIGPQPIGLFRLALYDVASRQLRDVAGTEFDRNAGNPMWLPDSRRLVFSTEDRVYQEVFAYDVASGRYSKLTNQRNITLGGITPDGSSATFTMESPDGPADVYVADTSFSVFRRLTAANPEIDKLALGGTDVITWTSTDGQAIEGLLLKPVGYVPGRRYPLLVWVHGGPASAHLANFRGTWGDGGGEDGQFWAGQGWAVFYPNPRGSRSYGDTFVRAVIGDWGGGDYRDIMAGVDALIQRGIANPDQLAIGGWSYGGYMTCWTVTQTNRFKAAMMGAALTNLVSFYGTSGIPGHMVTYFGGMPAGEALALYVNRSGFTFADRVTTPVLIAHGTVDTTVPTSQSYEFHRALKDRGKTVQFVVYPREGHVLSEHAHLLDLFERQYTWISTYTLGTRPAAQPK